jgi:hypothetical protein
MGWASQHPSKDFQINSNTSKLVNYKTGTSLFPTISKLCMVVDYFKMDNFHFGHSFQIPLDFELKIPETNQIPNLLEF